MKSVDIERPQPFSCVQLERWQVFVKTYLLIGPQCPGKKTHDDLSKRGFCHLLDVYQLIQGKLNPPKY